MRSGIFKYFVTRYFLIVLRDTRVPKSWLHLNFSEKKTKIVDVIWIRSTIVCEYVDVNGCLFCVPDRLLRRCRIWAAFSFCTEAFLLSSTTAERTSCLALQKGCWQESLCTHTRTYKDVGLYFHSAFPWRHRHLLLVEGRPDSFSTQSSIRETRNLTQK